jgi:hypothetical protein
VILATSITLLTILFVLGLYEGVTTLIIPKMILCLLLCCLGQFELPVKASPAIPIILIMMGEQLQHQGLEANVFKELRKFDRETWTEQFNGYQFTIKDGRLLVKKGS